MRGSRPPSRRRAGGPPEQAPLAWLSLEWGTGGKGGTPELCLTTWPGTTRKLATTDDRGREIRFAPGV